MSAAARKIARSDRCRAMILSLALAATLGGTSQAQPALEFCDSHRVAFDTSLADIALPVWFGRSLGQVFFAQDTLIRSITVWRGNEPEGRVNLDPMHLYITEAGSTGIPLVRNLILDGPTIVLTEPGDSIPDPVRYEFDPPLALPRRGHFFFAIKEDWCSGVFTLLGTSEDIYPDGRAWWVEPNVRCTGIGCCLDDRGEFDLIFEIEYCLPPVAAEEQTWGRVKSDYR